MYTNNITVGTLTEQTVYKEQNTRIGIANEKNK